MTARRVSVLGVLLLVVAALATWVVTAAGEPSFTEDLVSADADVSSEQVELDDGTALAVAVVDEEFVVQWRGPGESDWSAPEEVVDGSGLDADLAVVDTGGSTAVLGLSSYAEDDDERETHARTDAVVCRDYSCAVVAEDVGGSPSVSADGEYAVVPALSEETVEEAVDHELLTWAVAAGEWQEATVEGPDGEAAFSYDLVLLGDGSLATVRPDTGEGGCRYVLSTTEPRGTDLAEAARTDAAGGGSCTVESVEPTEDGDGVSFGASAVDATLTFTRDEDGAWTDSLPSSTLAPLERGGLAMVTTPLRGGGGTAAVGVPDGRRVLAQHRPVGDADWSRPVVLARVPEGQRCRSASPDLLTDTSDVVYAVACWPTGSRWASDVYDDGPPPTTGFALGSRDGVRWDVEPLTEPAYAPDSGSSQELLLVRSAERTVVWRSGARGFEEVRLPLANPTLDAVFVTGDSVLRVTGNPDPDAPCRPEWSVARLEATSWDPGGALGPIRAYARGPGRCEGAITDEGDNGRVERTGRVFRVVGSGLSSYAAIDGQVVRDGDRWSYRPYGRG